MADGQWPFTAEELDELARELFADDLARELFAPDDDDGQLADVVPIQKAKERDQ